MDATSFLEQIAQAEPAPVTPAISLVIRTATNEIVDVRLPDDDERRVPKGCTLRPVQPGGWRRSVADFRIAEAWPADEA